MCVDQDDFSDRRKSIGNGDLCVVERIRRLLNAVEESVWCALVDTSGGWLSTCLRDCAIVSAEVCDCAIAHYDRAIL